MVKGRRVTFREGSGRVGGTVHPRPSAQVVSTRFSNSESTPGAKRRM